MSLRQPEMGQKGEKETKKRQTFLEEKGNPRQDSIQRKTEFKVIRN